MCECVRVSVAVSGINHTFVYPERQNFILI